MKKNGKCISSGYAYGKIVTRFNNKVVFSKLHSSVEEAMVMFDYVGDEVARRIEKTNKSYSFLQAHTLIVKDPVLRKKVYSYMFEQDCSLEFAFSCAINEFIDKIKESDDLYLQERYLDLLDIKHQVLSLINQENKVELEEDSILISDELYPSDILNIDEKIKGIITFSGGFTNHSAILCRSMNIPYVVIEECPIDYDDCLISNEIVVFNPNEKQKERIISRNMTVNYVNSEIWANLSSLHCINQVVEKPFVGIGLYRTEFIFMAVGRFISYEEQLKIYREMLMKMYPRPVILRTFDFGDDKTLPGYKFKKGIENYKAFSEQIKTQLKAMIDTGYDNLRIMFPYIKTVEEFKEMKKEIEEITNRKIPVGMMLETKEAIKNIKEFIEADFFSLGTNDLLLELFNVSRDSMEYKEYLNPLKEALIPVVEFAKEYGKPISVCGEMAGIQDAVDMFLSIGINKFSIAPNKI